jgi:2-(1,2-epoxy-1,2-dihydrophenyl)acetyl-CoA isomerase
LARIILARPEAGNALDLELCVALRDAAGRCATDATVKAVLLTAEGRAFCVGGDLVEFSAKGEDRPAHLLEVAETFHAAQARLMGLQAPVVVAVQGAAAGAGLGLALCGDLVLAAPEAQFTAAYTAIGLSADGGSTHFLPRLIGLRRTQELLLLNRRLSAAEALDWGLVTAVSPNLAVEAEALARRLANGPTAAFGTIKRLLGATYARTFADQTRDEGLGISELSGGRHAAEGLAAFFAKRPPMFDA